MPELEHSYAIEQTSRLLGISAQKLRRWDEQGIPGALRTEGGHRRYPKEVVDRLVAVPRTKDYGRLSVLAQHVCTVHRLFDVAPSAFVPPPKVVSSVARLRPRPLGDRLADLKPLERVTAAAFGQRRKMLRGALVGLFADPTAVLTGLGLSPTARAEELTVAEFVRLAGVLDK